MDNLPPPPYAMLQPNPYGNQHMPNHRNIPRYHKKKSSCFKRCCRIICCCFCCIVMLFAILSILSFYLYNYNSPKVPSYKIVNFEVKVFDYQLDLSFSANFLVTVKTVNPNNHVGFIYGQESSVIVDYKNTTLCSGNLPSFYQGPLNATIMKVDLNGKSEFGSGLQRAYIENQNNQRIPLLVKIKVPVTVVLAEIPLRTFDVFANCSMLVDTLAPNKKIRIISNNITFGYDIWA